MVGNDEGVIRFNGVDNIGNYAFSNCVNINSIELHDEISEIGEGVFSGAVDLKTLLLVVE